MKSFGLPLLLLLFLLAGCGSPGELVGSWNGSPKTPKGPLPATIELRADSSFQITFPSSPQEKVAGTYSVSGSNINFTATNINGMEVGEADRTPEAAALSADRKSFLFHEGTFTKQ